MNDPVPRQRGQDAAFALDHRAQVLAVGALPSGSEFVLDGVQSEQKFPHGTGFGFAHGSLGKLDDIGARAV
ncbi:hypothetical protein [Kribbella sp. NPDC048915]|uniref:hypothetical protein n=1 Tax=Kribbella sp. NPDC048915 TaxID=3155148 RepID=UPI003406BBD8